MKHGGQDAVTAGFPDHGWFRLISDSTANVVSMTCRWLRTMSR
jgi:hypothetical protein